MKIHFLKEDALVYFKNNIDKHLEHYLDEDNSWMIEIYKEYRGEDESPFGEFKLGVDEIKMYMPAEKAELTDYNNVKILYNALKNISDTQATDERLWVGLAHNELWKFMNYRCKINKDNLSVDKIKRNYFFNNGNKRSLIVHPLARLWWVGRLTYDENSSEKYRALDYMKNDFGTKVLTLFSSNFTNNPAITRAILNAIVDIELTGIKVTRTQYQELIRYVNLLGGVIILDYLSEDELKDKIILHYCEIHNV